MSSSRVTCSCTATDYGRKCRRLTARCTTLANQDGSQCNADPGPDLITSAAALAQTYMTLLRTNDVLQAVVDKLQLPFAAGSLSGMFDGRIIQGTSFLMITVTYTDPAIATEVANELAVQLIANSPTQLNKDQEEQLKILQGEIRAAQVQLQNARNELNTIEGALATGAVSDADLAILTTRKVELINEINATQTNLATMTSTVVLLQQRGTINYARVVEKARIPTASSNPNPLNNTLLGAAVGAIGALAIAIFFEYINDSLRSPAEIMALLNVPLLGAIAPFGNKRSHRHKLITWTQPRSTVSEAYRALRVNVLFREPDDDATCRRYVVTSAGPSEGKSVTAANLAVTFAMTGMRVLVIDTDMRRPSVHQLFNLPNTNGLSSIWSREEAFKLRPSVSGRAGRGNELDSASNILRQNVRLYLSGIIQRTDIPGLDVVTAGPAPSNPAELLDTPQMHELIYQIAHELQYDVVIFDTPPVLVVTDASIIANVADAKALLVVESGRTRRGAARRAVQQLDSLSTPVLGVIMNRLRTQDRDTEYGYNYYYGYTQYRSGEKQATQLGTGNPGSPEAPQQQN